MNENPIEETIEPVPVQEAPNKLFWNRFCELQRDFILECQESHQFRDMNDIGALHEFIHRRLGNPDGL